MNPIEGIKHKRVHFPEYRHWLHWLHFVIRLCWYDARHKCTRNKIYEVQLSYLYSYRLSAQIICHTCTDQHTHSKNEYKTWVAPVYGPCQNNDPVGHPVWQTLHTRPHFTQHYLLRHRLWEDLCCWNKMLFAARCKFEKISIFLLFVTSQFSSMTPRLLDALFVPSIKN